MTAAQRSPVRYLVPCSCGHGIEVGLGQAGGTVRCPACGSECGVPRLGELSRLATVAAAPPTRTPWSLGHACLFGGGTVALLAFITGSAVEALTTGARGGAFDFEAVRSAVAAADVVEVYGAAEKLLADGVARPLTLGERKLLRMKLATGGIVRTLWSVGGIAAVVALGGGLLLASSRTASPPKPEPRG